MKSKKAISMVGGILIAVFCMAIFLVVFGRVVGQFFGSTAETALKDTKLAIENLCGAGYDEEHTETTPIYLPVDNGEPSNLNVRYYTIRIESKAVGLWEESSPNTPGACATQCHRIKKLDLKCPKNIRVSAYMFEASAGAQGQNPKESILLDVKLSDDPASQDPKKKLITFGHKYA